MRRRYGVLAIRAAVALSPCGRYGLRLGYALAFGGAHTPPLSGCEPFPGVGLRIEFPPRIKKPKRLDSWTSAIRRRLARRMANRIRRLENHVKEDLRRDRPSIGGILGGVTRVLIESYVRLVLEIETDAIRIHDEIRVTEF